MSAAAKIHPMYPVSENPFSEPTDKGFVSLFRSIRKHWIWQDAEKLKWWIDILLEVNHRPTKVLIGSKLIECKRGQSINSLQTWAKRWRTNVSAVRRFFKLLESDSMIVTENVSKTTRLTVCKYESYQDWRNDSETNMTRVRHEHETDATTNNNANKDNNDNKKNKGAKAAPFVPPTLDEVRTYFHENGYSDSAAQRAYSYYDVANWVDSKGNRVRNWKQKMQSVWFKEENKSAPIRKKEMVS